MTAQSDTEQVGEQFEGEISIEDSPLEDVAFWNIRAGEGGELWELWNAGSQPKITIGWDIGDPVTTDFEDASIVEQKIQEKYDGGPTNPAEQIRQFVTGASTSMEPGDFVVIHGRDASIEAIARVGELHYQEGGLEEHGGHTYWRPVRYLLRSERAGAIKKRSLPAKFSQGGSENIYFNQSHRTIEELEISSRGFQELCELLADRDETEVMEAGMELLKGKDKLLPSEHQKILKQWREVARTQTSGAEFDFKNHDRTQSICADANTFIEDPTEEKFKQMWDRMHSAVQRGNAAERLKQWEGSIEELATLIEEMRDANEYNQNWRDELGGRTTVWELFGSLHIETYPIINAATIAGLEFFGYEEPSTYNEGVESVSDFQTKYEQVVGHATAEAEHDVTVPLLMEIDQLFNIIDKADQESVAEESSEAARELYQQILTIKEGNDSEVHENTQEDEYASVQEGMDDVLEKLKAAGKQNWLRDVISKETVHRWVEPLKAVNHRPHSVLELRRCNEILDLFGEYETRLTNQAANLDIRQFSQLNPAESLFVVLLRDVQSNYVDEGLINHIKFKGIRERYHRTDQPTEAYFILRTGAEEYQDTKNQYEFRDGIPGYKQLLDAEHAGEAIFLEDGEFYGVGRIGDVKQRDTTDFEGKTRYIADIIGYQELETSIPQEFAHKELEEDLNRPPGIISITETDFEILLNRAFEDEREFGSGPDEVEIDLATDHPLLKQLTPPTTTRVFKCTAPIDYWYTSLRYGAVSFSEAFKNRWDRVSPGDVLVFHTQVESAHPDLDDYPSGILGAGIVGVKYRKSDDETWWLEEQQKEENYPLIAQLRRLFVMPGAESVDLRKPIAQRVEEDGLDTLDEQFETITGEVFPYERANNLRKQTVNKEFQPQKAFGEINADTKIPHLYPRALLTEMHEQLIEFPAFNLYDSFSGSISKAILEDLYFPDNQGERIRKQIQAALNSGKHIIFTGPPGTGKTVLARRVADELADNYPVLYTGREVTTATADWSTFETVGGYMPDPDANVEHLKFTPGSILGRLRDRQTGRPTNETVVIDEINRADIDKSFGQMLTALTGESVQLPYTTDEGDEIRLVSAQHLETAPKSHEYAIPESWTILATMNTRDKTSLYDLSYAFMRRFAQIRIGAPRFTSKDEAIEELRNYLEEWPFEDLDEGTIETFGKIWYALNSDDTERTIGPALVRDMLAFVANYEEPDDVTLTEATISYVLPQLEGVRNASSIAGKVASVSDIDGAMLEEAARDMLQIKGLDTE